MVKKKPVVKYFKHLGSRTIEMEIIITGSSIRVSNCHCTGRKWWFIHCFLLCPCGLKSAYELLKVTDNLSFIKNSFPIHISTEILSSEFYFLRCITNTKSLFDNCAYCLLVLIQDVRIHWKKDREIFSWFFQSYVFKKGWRGWW